MQYKIKYHGTFEMTNILLGGYDGQKCLIASEMYNIEQDSWSNGPVLPFAMSCLAAKVEFRETFALIVGVKKGRDS